MKRIAFSQRSKALKRAKAGWHSTESHDSYSNVHACFVYKGEPKQEQSVDVRFTISWESNSFYLVFGINEGDGVDELITTIFCDIGSDLVHELHRAIQQDESGILNKIYTAHPQATTEIQTRLEALQTVFSLQN